MTSTAFIVPEILLVKQDSLPTLHILLLKLGTLFTGNSELGNSKLIGASAKNMEKILP